MLTFTFHQGLVHATIPSVERVSDAPRRSSGSTGELLWCNDDLDNRYVLSSEEEDVYDEQGHAPPVYCGAKNLINKIDI